jgi:hypothetical protein
MAREKRVYALLRPRQDAAAGRSKPRPKMAMSPYKRIEVEQVAIGWGGENSKASEMPALSLAF